jgi:hypothetical protein
LSTLLGILLAVVTLTIASEPVRVGIARPIVAFALSLLALSVGFTAMSTLSALGSPLPWKLRDSTEWDVLIASRNAEIRLVNFALFLSLLCVAIVWYVATTPETDAWPYRLYLALLPVCLAVGALLGWIRRLVATRGHRIRGADLGGAADARIRDGACNT